VAALGDGLEFDEAKRRAEDWLSQFASSSIRTVKRETVMAALQTYLADLRRHGRRSLQDRRFHRKIASRGPEVGTE